MGEECENLRLEKKKKKSMMMKTKKMGAEIEMIPFLMKKYSLYVAIEVPVPMWKEKETSDCARFAAVLCEE